MTLSSAHSGCHGTFRSSSALLYSLNTNHEHISKLFVTTSSSFLIQSSCWSDLFVLVSPLLFRVQQYHSRPHDLLPPACQPAIIDLQPLLDSSFANAKAIAKMPLPSAIAAALVCLLLCLANVDAMSGVRGESFPVSAHPG